MRPGETSTAAPADSAGAAERAPTLRDARAPWTTLVAARAPEPSRRPPASTRAIVIRLAAGLVAVLVVVGVLATFAAQWLAEREAVNDAANVTDVLANAVVQPNLTDALADGDPDAVDAFDRVIRDQVLGDDVVRVKLWSPEGVVLYADEEQLIGRSFDLDDAQREALANPTTRAAVSDLSEDENVFESGGRLLEVYRPVWDARRARAALRDLPAVRAGRGALSRPAARIRGSHDEQSPVAGRAHRPDRVGPAAASAR